MRNISIDQNWATLIGRILFSLIFIFSGINKIFGFEGTVGYMEHAGITFFPHLVAVIAILFELGGGLLVLLGWHARLGAALLFVFTLLVTFALHHFWSFPPEQEQIQMIMFMKNISILGGALYIMAFGAGAYSIEAWLQKK